MASKDTLDSIHQSLFEHLMAEAKNLNGKKVLELGPGTKPMVYYLRSNGANAIAVDPEPLSHDPLVVLRGDATDLDAILGNEQFDYIISRNLLDWKEHEKFHTPWTYGHDYEKFIDMVEDGKIGEAFRRLVHEQVFKHLKPGGVALHEVTYNIPSHSENTSYSHRSIIALPGGKLFKLRK